MLNKWLVNKKNSHLPKYPVNQVFQRFDKGMGGKIAHVHLTSSIYVESKMKKTVLAAAILATFNIYSYANTEAIYLQDESQTLNKPNEDIIIDPPGNSGSAIYL